MNPGGIKLLTLLVVVAGSVALVASAECGVSQLSNDCGGCDASCFKVDENSPPGTCVGDLLQAPDLVDTTFLSSNRPLIFDFQSETGFCGSNVLYTNWLTIANSSVGTIRTVVELDSEYYRQICDPATCPQVFVSVKYADFQQGDMGALVFSVYFNLADINDNGPQFLHTKSTNTTVFIETVQETTNIGQDLFCSDQLVASDADTNEIITYSILSANFSYSKDNTNQEICIQNLSPLDRETTSNVSFILQAQDTGPYNVTKTSNLTVILELSDVNDNLPIFVDPNVSLSVHENAKHDSIITVFTATDEDVGLNAEISYSIILTPPDVPFGINNSTGALYVNGVLNADTSVAIEDQNPVSYSFEIVATDGGGVSSTKLTVTVVLIDINDNAPEFFKPIDNEFTFPEGSISENQVITSFSVRDSDYTPSNWSGYVTVGGNYARVQSNFIPIVDQVVRSNLLFRNVDKLDYEEVQDINVTFVISDGGVPALTVSASVIIHITDVNDNPPYLTQTEFQVSEQQQLIKGMVLFILRDYFQDVDSDADGNNQPGQFIQLGTNPYVKVLPSVGTVQVEQQLDRETTETISFNVMIFDMGNPPMNSTIMIMIYLQDINDNAPMFMEPVGPFEIPELPEVIVDFGHVMATDADAGLNGTVRYRLTGDSMDLFTINNTTGYLSSLVQLDREERSVYELTVIAEDMGELCNGTLGSCRSSKNVTVIVTDLNDNPPIFSSNVTTSFTINSTTAAGSPIGLVIATDLDTGINAMISYTLDNVTVFAIDDFGVISTVRELEAFDSGTYMLIVTAWNSQNSQLNSTLSIEITILQSNSTVPMAGIFETLQLFGSIALAALVLIIAIAIVLCCICCLCYHRRHTQSKNLPPLPPQTTPRKSSLKMVGPAQLSQDDDLPINGDVPRSPTVIFSEECQVRYFSQDQLMTKSAGKTETVRFAESKFDDATIESPQIPTKDVAPETEEISSPPLSEDLSSGSSLSNSLYHSTGAAAAGNQYYEHPPKNHHLPLREDTLKKHNEAISENYGGHGSMLYPPQGPGRHERMYPSEPYPISNGHYPHGIVEDERNQYNSLPLPPDIQHYLSSNNHSDQSISVAVSHYVSQNGTPPSAESSPRIQFVHPREPHPHHRMHGPPPPHTSTPAVYYSSHHRPPISPRYTMDQPPPQVYYEDSPHQKAGLQHYNSSSSSSNSSHNIHRPDISPPSPPPQSSRYPPPVMQNPFPRHSRHTHERPSMDGHLSPLAEYPPPSHLVPPNPHHSAHSRSHVSYTHPHMLPPLYSRGSFVSEGDNDNDNDTVASSLLDTYLQFDTHLPRPDYLLSDAISVDDR